MKRILAILCMVLLIFSFAGCVNKNGQPSPSIPSQTSAPKTPVTIACIYSSLEGEFWGIVANGTNAALEELKASGKISGDSYLVAPRVAGDVEQQKALLDEAIHNKVDGIVLSPAHADEIGTYVSDILPNLKDGGIPMIVIDRSMNVPYEFDCVVTAMTADVGAMSEACGELAREAVDGIGEYLYIGLEPNNMSSHKDARLDGIDWLDKNAPNLERCSFGDDGLFWASPAGGLEIVKPFLQEEVLRKTDKKQNLVIITATEPYTIAVCKAIKESSIQRTGKTIVIGFDFSQDMYDLIKSGEVYGTVGQNPYLMGYDSTILMADYLNDNKTVKEFTYVPLTVVSQNNLDSEEVQEYLATMKIEI